MRPRNRLRLVRTLLGTATGVCTGLIAVCSGLIVALAFAMKIVSDGSPPIPTAPETLVTIPSPDSRFFLTVRRVPVARRGPIKLVATIEDSLGSLDGPPCVLGGNSAGSVPALSWSNHTVLVRRNPDGPPTPIGRIDIIANGATSPSLQQVWE